MKQSLLHSRSGSTAAEFALVLPLLVLFIFGLIDAGRFMWDWNRAEKAAQMGARFAVVTDVVSTGLGTYSFVQPGGLTQGDIIPKDAIAPITCTGDGVSNASCTCTAAGASICPTNSTTGNGTAFKNIFDRMHAIDPNITAQNVQIIYTGSGLGYAGDPNGMDIAPLVTVNITSIPFPLISSLRVFGTSITNVSATLTAEDSSGTQSN